MYHNLPQSAHETSIFSWNPCANVRRADAKRNGVPFKSVFRCATRTDIVYTNMYITVGCWRSDNNIMKATSRAPKLQFYSALRGVCVCCLCESCSPNTHTGWICAYVYVCMCVCAFLRTSMTAKTSNNKATSFKRTLNYSMSVSQSQPSGCAGGRSVGRSVGCMLQQSHQHNINRQTNKPATSHQSTEPNQKYPANQPSLTYHNSST